MRQFILHPLASTTKNWAEDQAEFPNLNLAGIRWSTTGHCTCTGQADRSYKRVAPTAPWPNTLLTGVPFGPATASTPPVVLVK